jgi:hypothetical protein
MRPAVVAVPDQCAVSQRLAGALWERCQHRSPAAIVLLMIRWGADASSDMRRQSARCTRCGRKGATIPAARMGWTADARAGVAGECVASGQ